MKYPEIAPEIKKHLEENKEIIKTLKESFGIHKDIHGRLINAETEIAGHLAGDYMLKMWPDGSCERCYPYHPDFPKNLKN
tara:strand:- start:208 stop:447 length:240 start_codon:yes stop_codon:yes gene_type:complete